MKQAGYEVEKSGQDRFTRLRASTLGEGYDLKDIMAAIEDGTGRRGAEGCIYAG